MILWVEKKTAFILNIFFYKIIIVFTVSFDQFSWPCLIKVYIYFVIIIHLFLLF